MRARVACALVAAWGVAGCNHAEGHHVMFQGEPASGARGSADLYLDRMPSRPVIERGLVQSMGYGDQGTERQLLGVLRAEARRMGCDAVVRVKVSVSAIAGNALGVCVTWAPDEAATTR